MAFSEAERVKVRFYLGWSARFHQFDSALEQAMNAAEAESDTEDFIRDDLLVALEDIRTKLTASHNRLKAVKVGSIGLDAAKEVAMLRSEGARHANSLAATLGVELRHNVFGSGRFRYFASHTGLDPSATGRYLKHG